MPCFETHLPGAIREFNGPIFNVVIFIFEVFEEGGHKALGRQCGVEGVSVVLNWIPFLLLQKDDIFIAVHSVYWYCVRFLQVHYVFMN